MSWFAKLLCASVPTEENNPTIGPSEPRIKDLSWGKITIAQGSLIKTYKDCRLWPTGSEAWDWSKTGTRHAPGIQFSDFEDLLAKHPETNMIILTQGMDNVLQTQSQTLDRLRTEYPHITVHVANTKKAMGIYNDNRQTKVIIGLFHSTC